MEGYRLTGEAKVSGICEFMDNLLDNECKFLIFAHHKSVMDGIETFAKQKKVEYIRIDGSVSIDKRHERVQAFQYDQRVRVAILSITACSQGLTLTAASTVVFAELTWTPSIMNQAEDRAHRIGQSNSVNIYYLYGKNTIDDIIFSILSEKSQVVSDALDGIVTDYKINRAEKDEIVKEVGELKSKGQLNPVVVNHKKDDPKIDDFFKRKEKLNDFVADRKSKKKKKTVESEEEDVEESDEEEDYYDFGLKMKQVDPNINKTTVIPSLSEFNIKNQNRNSIEEEK